mgnify:CR=1 FL=1
MYGHDNVNKKNGFPDPLANQQTKESDAYGLQYAKAIHSQWGKMNEASSLFAKRNKVFEGVAHHGKGTMGWSYGFKLHLLINHLGEIVALKLTTGNVDDREPVSDMADSIFGKLYGDKGYISKALSGELLEKGVELITTVRKNMKKKYQVK